MFAAMRALPLALIAALAGCTCDPPSKPAAGTGSMRAAAGSERPEATGSAGPAGSAAGMAGVAGAGCTAETAIRVSQVLTDPEHPCHERVRAAHGRMVRVGAGSSGTFSGTFSGTIVSTAAARSAGLLVTCGSCAGAAAAELGRSGGMIAPERAPPLAIRVAPPARLAGGAVPAGVPRHAAHLLFGGNGFVIAALSGAPLEPAAAAPPAVDDREVALDDPRGLAASRAPFVDVQPGAAVLVLGFAVDAEGGELLASVGPVLDDAEARRRGYDPRTELAIAARAAPGMLGGGVFEEGGRFVGVVAGATSDPADGMHLVRAVRATAIAARLSAALRAAPVPLRAKIVPFLP